MLKKNKAYLLPHFKKAPIFFKTKSMIYVTLKTSTRIVHRCVNANQENINLQKNNTRIGFGNTFLTITCFGFE